MDDNVQWAIPDAVVLQPLCASFGNITARLHAVITYCESPLNLFSRWQVGVQSWKMANVDLARVGKNLVKSADTGEVSYVCRLNIQL